MLSRLCLSIPNRNPINSFCRLFSRLLILLIVVTAFIGSAVYGQSFSGGVHAGLVGSQVAGDLFSGYNKAGISAGGYVGLQISPNSVIQMELSYIQKGSRENPNYEKEKFDSYIMRLGYVELPFLYRMIYNDRLNFETGLGMNFLLHHYERYNSEELFSPFAKSNLCFILGLSYNINDRMRVNLRTNNSLFSIRTERVNGDVWRFFDHGQYSDALVFSLYYEL